MSARLIAGVAPPLDTIGAVPVTEVTGAVPDAASVIRPLASTVNETLVYEPAVTPVFVSVRLGVAPPDEATPADPVTAVTPPPPPPEVPPGVVASSMPPGVLPSWLLKVHNPWLPLGHNHQK